MLAFVGLLVSASVWRAGQRADRAGVIAAWWGTTIVGAALGVGYQLARAWPGTPPFGAGLLFAFTILTHGPACAGAAFVVARRSARGQVTPARSMQAADAALALAGYLAGFALLPVGALALDGGW